MTIDKQQIKEICQNHISTKIKTLIDAIEEAQSSANNETKSSAGDKHETSRAMAQLEVERLGGQLQNWKQVKHLIDGLQTDQMHQVKLGSFVVTDLAKYYLSSGIGNLKIEEIPFVAIGFNAPIGQLLAGKSVGDTIVMNGKSQKILEIY